MPDSNICVKECPAGSYYEPVSNQCEQCSLLLSDCEECSYSYEASAAVCTKCSAPSVRVSYSDGSFSCIDSSTCIDSSYINSISNSCDVCPSTCEACEYSAADSSLLCSSCKEGYHLLNSIDCVNECPTGSTVVVATVSECQYCHHNIAHCELCSYSSAYECQQCYSPYILH